ncbi:SCO family protein [Aquibacillus koreensis]|uniref:SCO family protein n=1 Tax=Aquibacillus koreensis TaxID=279446 RepID=A0A9X3WQ39_9BACI|nr:SCO family protein [Aquibacillus koreensis]MCT2536340.1 SCO family protein [Aquibacillus koreensis]MDC3421309.1 SCO family protein [Aquibacillus koreensis]
MNKKDNTKLAILLVIIFGIGLFYISTDGFRAYTAESARMYDLQQEKPTLPNVTLKDSHARTYSFDELAKDKYVFITFMYTNCGTVCPQLELNMRDVYKQIPSHYFENDLVFLSISFDPLRDNPEVLAKYRTYFDSDGETWRMARVNDSEELTNLLETLGVIVIPDDYGNFQHNSAFYLISPKGQLVEVMDFTKVDTAASILLDHLDKKVRD